MKVIDTGIAILGDEKQLFYALNAAPDEINYPAASNGVLTCWEYFTEECASVLFP